MYGTLGQNQWLANIFDLAGGRILEDIRGYKGKKSRQDMKESLRI